MVADVPGRSAARGFVERNLAGLMDALDHAARADADARRGGWLQGLDPRAKLLGFGALIIAAVGARNLYTVLAMFLVAAGLAVSSCVQWRALVTQVWIGALVFTGLIALPAVFLTPGREIYKLPLLHWAVTAQGLRAAGMLIGRAETTATLAWTMVFSTRWTQVLKALRVLRVPTVAVVILGMTYRYIFLLLGLATDFFAARRSRQIGVLDAGQRHRVAIGAVGVLLDKSLHMSGEVYQAMQSRGFAGEVYTLDDFHWRGRDTTALLGFLALAAGMLWLGWE